MPVKISKVAKDLNVGTQTLIDFLSKKKITVDSNPNARISDEHYQMLLNEFKTTRINASNRTISSASADRRRLNPRQHQQLPNSRRRSLSLR